MLSHDLDNMSSKIIIFIIASFALSCLGACRNTPGNRVNNDADSNRNSSPTSTIEGLVLVWPVGYTYSGKRHVYTKVPLAGATISIIHEGVDEPLRTVMSDSLGRFRISVVPGKYTLIPMYYARSNSDGYPRPLEPSTVEVNRNATVNDTLEYDTGIGYL